MRTTLTLDPDVVRLIEDAVHRERRSTKAVINDALRKALGPAVDVRAERYEVAPHHAELRAGIDVAGFNRLADEIEDGAILDRANRAP